MMTADERTAEPIRIMLDVPRRMAVTQFGWRELLGCVLVKVLQQAVDEGGMVTDGLMRFWCDSDASLTADNRVRIVGEVDVRPAT
jgi:hypothetical protein